MRKLWSNYYFAILLILFSFATALLINGPDEGENYMKIKVAEGDTLWTLSNEFSNEHSLSPQQFVSLVETLNGISGDLIYPGDEIVIPVGESPADDIKIYAGE
ncbi:cell division suppressor protein YneA [Bacillus canaveralius]|uniref:Cell division suppressor protein YneA n=2 Tax=Bacillaceae TaxID=186817 RepID=A0A2N5GK69_9BACI|nr:cell division suppressor protein YneA [Bacillus canaveralius]PLR86249.1 cell division suppressor protein YneA [Bacillus sp. V33-4]PLR96742.1 cell division suppressor protein YneA [Bacillus canaveralius]RSK49230.1 LysM peptidoglycan-binding domain-containing protein [Bacillus canaveralius]